MTEISAAVQNSVTEFLAVAAKDWLITAAYLYGSEPRGQAGPWSDIDIAVIFPDFAANLFAAQLALLQLAAKVDERLEPHAFTPNSFTPTNPLAGRDRIHWHPRGLDRGQLVRRHTNPL